MHRRDLIALLGTGATASLLSPLSASERFDLGQTIHASLDQRRGVLDRAELALVTRIADLILPRTDTPGASDVGVPAFIDAMLAGWYSDGERADFRRGLAAIDRLAGGDGFLRHDEVAQNQTLERLDGREGAAGSAEAAFRTVKSLTLHGYFTSETIRKRVLGATVIPGRFDGCVQLPGR